MSSETTKAFSPRLIAESSAKYHINAPTSQIDVTDWLFNVDELEYIHCTPRSKAHFSAGLTHTPEGGRVSINVELIGDAFIVEHYHEDISEKLHCRVQSESDFAFGREFTTGHVTWELIATPKEGNTHEFTNNVSVHTTEKFEQYLAAHHLDFEKVRHDFQVAVDAHNAEETPFFAAGIERKALKKK